MTNQKKKRGPPPKGSRPTPQRTRPVFVTPMAAQVVKRLPEGDEWIYELKFDGYRALILKDHDRVEIRSHLRREIAKTLKPLHIDHCPFVDLPNSTSDRWGGGVTADEMREMQWVSPELVAQVRFGHFHRQRRTHYDHLRQPHSFHSDRYQRQGYGGVHGVRGRGRYFHGQRRAHYDHRR